MIKRLLIALAFLAWPAAAGAATLTGTVSWANASPRHPVDIAKDRAVCAGPEPLLEPFVEVDRAGRVSGAIVWIDTAPPEAHPPEAPITIDQVGCMFVPVAAVTTVGSPLRITTSDPVLHNVHVVDGADRTLANWAMPVQGQEVTFRLERLGELRLRCEAGHTWMRATIRVLDHRAYATTGAGGRFTISGAPPGLHRVVAWHPEIGRVEETVLIPALDVPVRLNLKIRSTSSSEVKPGEVSPVGRAREKGVSHRDEGALGGP